MKKSMILAAVLAASLAVAVPALAQESVPDTPLKNQNYTCPDELLERVLGEYTPDVHARDCGLEEGVTSGATQKRAEGTEQEEAVDDKFSASGDKDATIDAPSTVSEGAERTDAQRDEPPALKVSPTEQTGASPQAGAQPEAGAESADSTQDSSSEGTTPEKQVASTDKYTASELGPSEEEVASGGRIASKGTLPEGNAARKAAARGGTARTDSGARKVIRNEARKSTKPKAINKQDRKAAHKTARVSAAGSSKKDQKTLRKAARASVAGSKKDRKDARKAARSNTSANKKERTPDKVTAASEEETTESKDVAIDAEATPGDTASEGEGDNTSVATPTKSNVPLFLGGGLVFVMSAFLVSKVILWGFRSPLLSHGRWLLRP